MNSNFLSAKPGINTRYKYMQNPTLADLFTHSLLQSCQGLLITWFDFLVFRGEGWRGPPEHRLASSMRHESLVCWETETRSLTPRANFLHCMFMGFGWELGTGKRLITACCIFMHFTSTFAKFAFMRENHESLARAK